MSHINLSEIVLSNLKIAKTGRTLKLIYNGKPFSFATNTLRSPFGVKVAQNNWSNFTTNTIECSFVNQENVSPFEPINDRIRELILENPKLFNGTTEFMPIFRGNPEYPLLIKLTLPRDRNGNFDFVLFDENKNKVFLDDLNVQEILAPRKQFKAIIECAKIWVFNERIGVTWNISQMKFSSDSNAESLGSSGSQVEPEKEIQTNIIDSDVL